MRGCRLEQISLQSLVNVVKVSRKNETKTIGSTREARIYVFDYSYNENHQNVSALFLASRMHRDAVFCYLTSLPLLFYFSPPPELWWAFSKSLLPPNRHTIIYRLFSLLSVVSVALPTCHTSNMFVHWCVTRTIL
jgi:hypothetical protein